MLAAGSLTRTQLRRQLREQRRALNRQAQRQAAQGLYQQLAQHPRFRRAQHIALYLPNVAKPPTCRYSAPGHAARWCFSEYARTNA
jgi:5-formyltetrahydrofolate cyclo-ligase